MDSKVIQLILLDLSKIIWFGISWKEFSKCRVCGKTVSDRAYRLAAERYIPPICSYECTEKEDFQRHACCDQARVVACVCFASFECPIHGRIHIGTHD